MGFKSDIEIAQDCEMLPITKIAEKAGIDDKYLEQYGKYKAKIDYNLLKESDRKDGKLILMTAINPTPAGEGKTTTTVGLADAMQKLGTVSYTHLVWMPKELKEFVAERLNKTAQELYGIENFTDMIGDETVATDPEALVEYLTEKGHPALAMDPMM